MLPSLSQLLEVLGTGHSDDQGTQREDQADADTRHKQQGSSLGVGCGKNRASEGLKGLILDLPSILSEKQTGSCGKGGQTRSSSQKDTTIREQTFKYDLVGDMSDSNHSKQPPTIRKAQGLNGSQ